MVPFKFDVTASPSILIPAQDYVPTQVVRLEPDASSPAGLFAVTWNSGTFAVALDRYTLDQTVFPPVAAGLAPVALSAPDGITDAIIIKIPLWTLGHLLSQVPAESFYLKQNENL